MSSGKGYRGGFNPYRDSHGRFSTGNGGGGGQQINAALRRAAGRGAAAEPAQPPLPPLRSLDEVETRSWYNTRVGTIPTLNQQWEASGVPILERARRCHEIRHDARVTARALMRDQEIVADLRVRDQEKYGNPDGPTFAYLVASWKRRGIDGDEIFESIIGGSARTNAEVNARYAQPQKGATT